MEWVAVGDKFAVLTLARDKFPPVPDLPDGLAFTDHVPRDVEERLLREHFDGWERPFHRRMPGARDDGVVGIVEGDEVVAFGYMCDDNELGLPRLGQGHYVIVIPRLRGRRLYPYLYAKLLERAADWGLDGIVIITDRGGQAEMYERWGAVVHRRVPKDEYLAAAAPRPSLARRLAGRVRRTTGR